ncbi:MAG TPA: hypothetical protein DDW50_14865 [Firmicutes bacterium]|jgi:hypothetical protein|nr:hypothetical protein [Bacillota bacterium]
MRRAGVGPGIVYIFKKHSCAFEDFKFRKRVYSMIYANDHKSETHYVSVNTLIQSRQKSKRHYPTYEQFRKEQEAWNHPRTAETPKKEVATRQESEAKRSNIPVNGLDKKNAGKTARQIYNEWQNDWLSKASKAHQEEKALREKIQQKDPAVYARNYDLFTHGQTNVFGREYEMVYNVSQYSSMMLDNAPDVLNWIEARVASGHKPKSNEIDNAAIKIIKGRETIEPIAFAAIAWKEIEVKEVSTINEAQITEDITPDTTFKGGEGRAAQYSKGWGKESMKDVINKIASGSSPISTDSGKIIYKNVQTGKQVVYDIEGNYFRIEDTIIQGKRTYTDVNGNLVPNNKVVNGKQSGLSQGEYNQMTHFSNTDTDFPYDRK